MTAPIAASARYTPYNPVVATTEFPVGFAIYDNSDVALFHEGLPVTFTVTSTYNADSISTDAVCVVSPGIIGLVEVVGLRAVRRTDQYADGQPLPTRNHNYSLNRLTAELQEARRDITRSLKVKYADGDPGAVTPDPGKVVGWDENLKLKNFINSAAEAQLEADRAERAADAAEDSADRSRAEADRSEAEADRSQAAADIAVNAVTDVAEQVELAEEAADRAEDARDEAQLAAAAALLNGMVFLSTAAGIAATSDGDIFWVLEEGPEGYPVAQSYLNDSGVAVAQDFALASNELVLAIYALIQPGGDPLTVKDPLGNIVGHIGAAQSIISSLIVTTGADGALEFRDRRGNVYARIHHRETMFNGWRFVNDPPNTIRLVDRSGSTLLRIGMDEAMISGLFIKKDGAGVSLRDSKNYVRFAQNELETRVEGIVIRPDGADLKILDRLGYVLWRAGLSSGSSVAPEPTPTSTVPLFGPNFYAMDGQDTMLFLTDLLSDRMDAALCECTLMGEGFSFRQRTFVGSTAVRGETIGDSLRIVVHPRRWDGDVSSELNTAVRMAPTYTGAPIGMKINVAGDSIPTYQGLYWQQECFNDWGYPDPEWIGTQATEGGILVPATNPIRFENDPDLLGETNPGHELADMTYLLTTTVSPLAPGGEAGYMASSLADKRLKNAYLIAQDGSYPAGDVRNGYVIDFDFYFDRFGLDHADVLQVSYGTNDITQQTGGSIFNRMYNEASLVWRRWRAHDDFKPMIFMMPGTGRGLVRDPIWKEKYANAIRGLLQFQKDAADPNLHLVPVWAHVVSDTGYDMTPSEQLPDPITGVIQRKIKDPLHPFGPLRRDIWRMMAMATAYAVHNIET